MTQHFWKPEPIRPTEPERTWIARTLRASLWVSFAGAAIYGLFAFAFDDIKIISPFVQSVMVIVGSALIVTGAELNTPPTVVAVCSKIGAGTASKLDIRALLVSLIGNGASMLIALSIRQTRFADSWWRHGMLAWGPLVAGLAVTGDYYAAASELGLLKADYLREMKTWLAEKETWLREEAEWNAAHGVQEPVDRSQWAPATIDHIRELAQRMNGQRAGVTPDNLQAHLDAKRLRVDAAPSTVRRWIKEEFQ